MGATAGSVSFVSAFKCRPPRSELNEIRVCTNRTCSRQGSINTLHNLSALAPPDVTINRCGCLGRCGAGPNILALPQAVLIGHCATASQAIQVMLQLTASSADPDASLLALALFNRAHTLLHLPTPNVHEALHLLSQAIALKPFGGIHVMYKLRSVARLGLADHSGALEDVTHALNLAPNFTEAYICQGDIFMAMDKYDAADKSYATSLEIDPSLRRSKSFKNRIAKLQEKLNTVNVQYNLN